MELALFEQYIRINDRELYGNEAADDEEIEKLRSYFCKMVGFDRIVDPDVRLLIIRAKKGMGKSAVLRYGASEKATDAANLSLYLKDSDFYLVNDKYPFPDELDPANYVHTWQQRICARIAFEIGKLIKIPTNYLELCLKFNSDQIGHFTNRNIVKGIVDHLELKLAEIEVGTKDVAVNNSIQLLKDYSNGKKAKNIWVFVDDIDSSFVYSAKNSLIITSFINACRNLIRETNNLNIRCGMRTDVISSVIDDNETTDKTDQYYFDIKWSQKDMKLIVARRCWFYLRSEVPMGPLRESLKDLKAEQCISMMFKGKFYWAGWQPTNMLNVYSASRPRWALQLMRMAADDAVKKGNTKITYGEIKNQMHQYGANRVAYIVAEHRHQCNYLNELILCFRKQNDVQKYPDLLVSIKNVVQAINDEHQDHPLEIDQLVAKKEKIILEFLFKVGFLNKVEEREGSRKLIKYEDEPLALSDLVNLPDSYWEIHPAYRYYLALFDTRNGENYVSE